MHLRSCSVGLLGSIGICINLNEQTIFVIDQEIIQIPKFLIKNGIKNILFRHMHSIKTNLAFFSMTAREIWRVSMLSIYRDSETHSLYLSTLTINYPVHLNTALCSFYTTHRMACSLFIVFIRHRCHVPCMAAGGGRTGGWEGDCNAEEMQWHSHMLKELNFHIFKFMIVQHGTSGESARCLVVCWWTALICTCAALD